MKKRFMPTVAAFVILLGLLVYANYYETEEILLPGVQKPVSMLECSEDAIRSITWKNTSEAELKLTFSNGESRIVAPAEYRSDEDEATGLLKHFAQLRSELIIAENATDTSAFGITASSPVVIVETASKTTRLTLGDKTEVGGSYYMVRQDDPRVFMVPGYISGSFAKQIGDLRDRRFFYEDFGQVVEISISSANQAIVLKQASATTDWLIESPVSLPADGVVVAQLLKNIHDLRVSRFVEDAPDDPAGYGFASPSLKIAIVNKEGREFVLEAGEMSGVDTYVRVGGSAAIHAADTTAVGNLRFDTDDLREKLLPVPPLAEITTITLADATGSLRLEQKASAWMLGVQKITAGDVHEFVNALATARVNSFERTRDAARLAGYGLQAEEKCRLIEIKGSSASLRLLLGNRKGATLSLLAGDELVDISAELDEAFTTFINRLRRPVETGETVMGEPASDNQSQADIASESSAKNEVNGTP
ncbi:MAG TPA: DUF4340 domain-containing protein [Candidatus Rifleibacterium sp.]|nr:DUF4340 domain-containing protein [Candidatus Rifleibacterium sp.]HPT46707.1 DUF4340 domain-containing protein [Candidatus Rifleibacterium sp.]